MGINTKVSGAWTGNVVPWARVAGTWRVPLYVWARVSGIWVKVGQKLLGVTTAGVTSAPRGTVISGVSAAPNGGYGPVTYAWVRQSGTAIITGGSLSSNPFFSNGSSAGTSVFRCTCTDSRTGDSAYADVTLTWT